MSRFFALQTWVGSHENEPDYDGNQCGSRYVRSVEAIPLVDIYGKANVNAFSEAAIMARRAKVSSVPLKDRILPQARRVRVLTEQLYELEAERKNGLDIQTYSQLRDVLIVKRDRAELLLQKALSVRPIRSETDEDSAQVQAEYTPPSGFSPQPNDRYASEEYEEIGVVWIDELSDSNSLKNILKKACIITRKVIHYKHKMSGYINTLKEV